MAISNSYGGPESADQVPLSARRHQRRFTAYCQPVLHGRGPVSAPYSRTGSLNDVTSGTNNPANPGLLGLFGTPNCGTPECNAGPGYDRPTRLATPAGAGAF